MNALSRYRYQQHDVLVGDSDVQARPAIVFTILSSRIVTMCSLLMALSSTLARMFIMSSSSCSSSMLKLDSAPYDDDSTPLSFGEPESMFAIRSKDDVSFAIVGTAI
ncbi:hypothetical protein ACHAXM_011145 [Skeletonema potamos]